MRVGIPREIKPDEYRVSLTPAGVREFTTMGHAVFVERQAGEGSGFSDGMYVDAGATIVPTVSDVFAAADLIVKVKEPLPGEYELLQPTHILCTFLHLAPEPELTRALVATRATCIAYETVETDNGELPLLAPMSEVAGRLAAQTGANLLERSHGGKGKLIGGITGVAAARVCILGAGVAGFNAALVARGMRARVVTLDVRRERLEELVRVMPDVECLMSNRTSIEQEVEQADLVIGAVLVPGARAPRLVSEDLVKEMEPGSVIIDLSVDQGGCVATSHMTTHSDPTYLVHGVVHCCIGNMPSVVPVTSTVAMTNSTLPYLLAIAERGLPRAARELPALARGINLMEGKVTNRSVAEATGLPYTGLDSVLPIDFT